MYIEFEVQNYLHLQALRHKIDSWQLRYGVPVTQKTVRYRHRVGMNDEQNFTVFFLTWQGPEYKIIHNRNH